MKALAEHLMSEFAAGGCGILAGMLVGWKLFMLKSRLPAIVGTLFVTFVIIPIMGVPGALMIFMTLMVIVAVIAWVGFEIASRNLGMCRRMLDAMARRRQLGDQVD